MSTSPLSCLAESEHFGDVVVSISKAFDEAQIQFVVWGLVLLVYYDIPVDVTVSLDRSSLSAASA